MESGNRSVRRRIRIQLFGSVQGVGFRPFVWRLAKRLDLTGWVANSAKGVIVEIEGQSASVDKFLAALKKEKPQQALVQRTETSPQKLLGQDDFIIRDSFDADEKLVWIAADQATCPDCLKEIFDPSDRRYQYPFTNCVNCGPRFSILERLPYDRVNTTMRDFAMCGLCAQEYKSPENRRYHAQPNACPDCGPQIKLTDRSGRVMSVREEALSAAAGLLRSGKVLAIKGLGGYHLAVNAADEEAVRLLRSRKHREEKPLAVMIPSLEEAKKYCEISHAEEKLLLSPEAPIVLLRKKNRPAGTGLAAAVAPGNPSLGLFVPYTPLHYLLMRQFNGPCVMTSGNATDEPMVTDEDAALQRLGEAADYFLMHNRRIVRGVDDSVVRHVLGRPQMIRRARGYAPLPISWKNGVPNLLCVGGQLKNTIAQTSSEAVFVSQHIGDLENQKSREAFAKTTGMFRMLYDAEPDLVCRDMHPDYCSSLFAESTGKPVLAVQHHFAHILSCMAEHGLEGSVLGVAWDGTGYGEDGTVWGGEFLRVNGPRYERVATFRRFRLPGSERAVREGRRSAFGLLQAMDGGRAASLHRRWLSRYFSSEEVSVLCRMTAQGAQSPWTSSAGRFFDAVSALLEIRSVSSFEAQAAMELEFAIGSCRTRQAYEAPLKRRPEQESLWVYDWEPAIKGLLEDRRRHIPVGRIAAKIHNTLAQCILNVCRKAGQERVVLSGGCFQNRYLLEKTVFCLRRHGFKVYWHERVPTHDGGIALGQAEAARRLYTDRTALKREEALCV